MIAYPHTHTYAHIHTHAHTYTHLPVVLKRARCREEGGVPAICPAGPYPRARHPPQHPVRTEKDTEKRDLRGRALLQSTQNAGIGSKKDTTEKGLGGRAIMRAYF
eukprot:1159886-Pelagomonas_calceolata.AAC.10